MAAKIATYGYLRMGNADTFTAPTPNKQFQPRALIWAGMGSAQTAQITDAKGSTVCYMSTSAKYSTVTIDGHFWGEATPWLTPITFTPSGGATGGYLFIVT